MGRRNYWRPQLILWLIVLNQCAYAHSDHLNHASQNQEKAIGAPNQVWPSHEHASSQSRRCSDYPKLSEAQRHAIGLLHLRGGVSHSKSQSCYPLHGEGDTEGREIGSRADPYSVASVSAAPPAAVGEIERIFMEVLRDNPKEISVRMLILYFVAFLLEVRCFAII
jgi:hypothetical protein